MKRAEEKNQQFGKVLPAATLILREHVGDATCEDKNTYEMSVSVGSRLPVVRSGKSGKWFTLSWTDIVTMARDAGIDAKEKSGEKSK